MHDTVAPRGLAGWDDASLLQALAARGGEQADLFAKARARRDISFPTRRVEVRSVIETGNSCGETCRFCAIPGTARANRYMLDLETFQSIVGHLHANRRRVLLLQSGEDRSQRFIELMCRCIEWARQTWPELTLILCFGNLRPAQFRRLRDAGGDRYILKFETSNPALYETVKPGASLAHRIECLENLIELGFGVGTGSIVGLPGQTDPDLVEDLKFIARYGKRLTMASASIFVPGAGTAYADEAMGDLDRTLNVMALLRILLPHALIPTTSSLEHARTDGQLAGLMAGANTVTIHDGTPQEFKDLFPIYSERRITPREERLRRLVQAAGLKFGAHEPAEDAEVGDLAAEAVV